MRSLAPFVGLFGFTYGGYGRELTPLNARLEAMRAWLVLLARLHLDARFPQNDASDIAQDALADALKYRGKIEMLPDEDLQRWMRRVLRHKLIDFYRKRRTLVCEADLHRVEADVHDSFLRLDRLAADAGSSPSEHVAKEEDWIRLAAALEELTETYREAFVLKDLALWPLRIAEHQGCTVGVVAGRLRRARETLQDRLAEHE